ncbi:hypothetical protein Psfp_00838 [Pelotomaculum sp. FP]|nr:hypothetical protein Psfp_00838 [Pelotomaculum sp. FP]
MNIDACSTNKTSFLTLVILKGRKDANGLLWRILFLIYRFFPNNSSTEISNALAIATIS